jgi:hypothetical protein
METVQPQRGETTTDKQQNMQQTQRTKGIPTATERPGFLLLAGTCAA